MVKDAIRSAVNELERAGYIECRQTTDEGGKFSSNEYIIHEQPVSLPPSLDKPLSENPTTGKPTSENPTQLNKDRVTKPPHYIVVFKSRDADNLEQAFKEFTAKKLSRKAKPSIRKALSVPREAAGRNVQRDGARLAAKEKIRERGMEL